MFTKKQVHCIVEICINALTYAMQLRVVDPVKTNQVVSALTEILFDLENK